MGITINRSIYRPLQDITLAAGKHLVLPQHNDATTPTLAFGDGDSGFYEKGDDDIGVALVGSLRFRFVSGSFRGVKTNAPLIVDNTPSAIFPPFAFSGDSDTGIGSAAVDQLSLIAGGEEGLRISEANGVANMNIICHGNEVICHENEVVTCGSA